MARFDKLTLKATEALQAAQENAARRHHQNIEVEHLLLALLEQTDGVVLPLLKKLGVDPVRVKGDIEEALN
ncbi:MAG TPA: Clp protease N-terminal domain-containing protein, partial [Nitrospirota bacterium]|nr:Clp protease N-terminal domain-containing protein [Nitrospirota bacterium]